MTGTLRHHLLEYPSDLERAISELADAKARQIEAVAKWRGASLSEVDELYSLVQKADAQVAMWKRVVAVQQSKKIREYDND